MGLRHQCEKLWDWIRTRPSQTQTLEGRIAGARRAARAARGNPAQGGGVKGAVKSRTQTATMPDVAYSGNLSPFLDARDRAEARAHPHSGSVDRFGVAARAPCARRRLAQSADEAALRIVGVRDETAAAARARRQLQQTGGEVAHQRPGARQAQRGLFVVQTHVFEIEPVALHDRAHGVAASLSAHEQKRVVEQRGMHVGLPRHEPVGRERQHALGRRFALHFLIKTDQAVARQRGFRFEHLQACTEFDHFDRQCDFLDLEHDTARRAAACALSGALRRALRRGLGGRLRRGCAAVLQGVAGADVRIRGTGRGVQQGAGRSLRDCACRGMRRR
ncbi:hypothetical protein PT2222_200136 [Paraburkholderia tropica]